MNNFPDFSNHGYQVQKELGHNRTCGRVTYLAIDTKTYQPVVIKQFQFAQIGASWSDYEAVEREIEVLRELNHPSIPRYLDSFQTPVGFCLVQEYKQAPSLAQPRRFTPGEIKQIAVAVLQVLLYLQQQKPPIIHRDIKPENILVDRQDELKVYLVDFGFAHVGDKEVTVSSAVKGTLGFMPPEQLFNRQLTEASDLYSLGATLICLLTKTKSSEIGNLIDEAYRIDFNSLVPDLSPEFIEWLEEMVAPNLKNRFDNAADALQVLRTIDAVSITTPETLVAEKKYKQGIVPAIALGACAFLGTSFTISSVIESAQIKRENFYLHEQLSSNSRESDWQLQQLLVKTRECPECELGGAELRGAQLWGANLRRAYLHNANLAGANLERANLAGANLWQANLVGTKLADTNLGYANLGGAKLEGADLRGANLWGAKLGHYVNLRGANLQNANLGYAHLLGAYFGDANLRGVSFWGANLSGAYLGGANLAGAKLGDSNLEGANLTDADLEDANLEGTKLAGAKLLGAYLESANLSEAYLDNADLRGANLKGANLNGAYLKGANLRGANLLGANLNGANLRDANLKGATMPDGTINK